VEPGPIIADQRFAVGFTGHATFDETFLNDGVRLFGFKRVAVLDMRGTVHVRKGATGDDVALNPTPIEKTCTYDEEGNEGPNAGPFPSCLDDDDCTGLGSVPDPLNRCLAYYPITTSEDCAPDGVCDSLGATGPNSTCDLNGFCVSGDLEIPLGPASGDYVADSEGNVLFGWDDESTGAILQEDGRTWILPKPEGLEEPFGPNGFRALVGPVEVVFACTMGVETESVSRRMGDVGLISCPIEDP
jgi:hypothetical protein